MPQFPSFGPSCSNESFRKVFFRRSLTSPSRQIYWLSAKKNATRVTWVAIGMPTSLIRLSFAKLIWFAPGGSQSVVNGKLTCTAGRWHPAVPTKYNSATRMASDNV